MRFHVSVTSSNSSTIADCFCQGFLFLEEGEVCIISSGNEQDTCIEFTSETDFL